MSANNYLLIEKKGDKYILLDCIADDTLYGDGRSFVCEYDTLENAVLGARCQMNKAEDDGYFYEYGLQLGEL